MNEIVHQRRFEELPLPDAGAVKPLGDDHPAIARKTTLFEKSITRAGDSERAIFISGENNRKIGRVIVKGAWRGLPIYALTLVERQTCPTTCATYAICYGNAMPFARRHAPGRDLEERIRSDVADLLRQNPDGIAIRLHVLGDFYSRAYAELWLDLLTKHKRLHVYGYTAVGTSNEPEHVEVATLIETMNDSFPERCAIRWSSAEPQPMGTVVINRNPGSANVEEGLVCPAEREATACCATCGMCWESATRAKTIVFVAHGFGSKRGDRVAREASTVDANGSRKIAPIASIAKVATKARNTAPTMMWAVPTDLYVDQSYQRNLSRKSIQLITRIVQNWNWTHFKPPIVTRTNADLLEVIDGQHTAIAAATHPDIDRIPIMIVQAGEISERARAFVGHNTDRIAVTPLQLHRSALRAEDAEAVAINSVCEQAGVTILTAAPPTGYRPRETTALGAIRGLLRQHGTEKAVSVLTVLADAKRGPIRADEIKAVAILLFGDHGWPVDRVGAVVAGKTYEHMATEARDLVHDTGLTLHAAMATVYSRLLSAEDQA